MIIVPTDSPSVFDALNTLVLNGAQIAVVRPNNPPPGIAGFIFDLPGEDTTELESDIPDHYVEANTPVQDQIALRPETVTVGAAEVAELVRVAPTLTPVTEVTNPLPLLEDLEPELSPGAQEQQDETEQSTSEDESAVASTQSLYGYYSARVPAQPNQTKQSIAFGYMYQLWKGRQILSVETPWGFFTNMAILSIAVRQSPETRVVSDFTITFKKIHTARSITITPGLLAGRATFQRAPITQNGTVGQVPLTTMQSEQFYKKITPPS